MIKRLLAVACTILFLNTVAAQVPPLITDRPDFTESPQLVPVNDWQLELGGTSSTADGNTALTMGEALLRFGLSSKVELRAVLPSYLSGDGFESGFDNMSIGFKTPLANLDNGMDIALLGAVSIPTGSDDVASNYATPSLIVAAGKSLSSTVSIGAQVQGMYEKQGNDRNLNMSTTFVSGFSLSGKAGMFTEVAASFPQGLDAQLTFHTGVVFAVTNLSQLDLHAGLGLTEFAPDSFIGLGFSIRK